MHKSASRSVEHYYYNCIAQFHDFIILKPMKSFRIFDHLNDFRKQISNYHLAADYKVYFHVNSNFKILSYIPQIELILAHIFKNPMKFSADKLC